MLKLPLAHLRNLMYIYIYIWYLYIHVYTLYVFYTHESVNVPTQCTLN